LVIPRKRQEKIMKNFSIPEIDRAVAKKRVEWRAFRVTNLLVMKFRGKHLASPRHRRPPQTLFPESCLVAARQPAPGRQSPGQAPGRAPAQTAGAQGVVVAQSRLGQMLCRDCGNARDRRIGHELLRQAARAGDRRAQLEYARLCEEEQAVGLAARRSGLLRRRIRCSG
jgi:hypothetical protein